MEAQANENSCNQVKRPRFSPQEDLLLIELVNKYGYLQMKKISKLLPGRNKRQCEERWNGFLAPHLTSLPWT
jgi:hypothetical protein